ncbi:MAG: hypothetical protein ABGW77_03755, partial [Campylobacterales bacterium]
MILEEVVRKSQIILISGEPRVGKLLFTLYSLARILEGAETLFLTPIPEMLMRKRFEGVQEVGDGVVNQYIRDREKFRVFYFKENYPQLKKQYPIKFLLEDITRAIEREGVDYLFFHRMEQFFEIQDIDLAEEFMK